ncbi:mce related family protein [Mycobacterium intracellulare]|nr:mce related family protein [Mycobacterium intracellulare]
MLTPFIRRQLIAFGILTVISLLVLGVYYLQIPSLMGIGRYTLKAELPASGGLYPTANVTYRGITIGKVTDVEPTERGAEATMSIDSHYKIPADTIANVHSVSAVGEQYLDLVSSGNPGKYLADGQTITKGTVPAEIGPALDTANRGLAVLPKEKIGQLLDETAQSVGGLGPALQRLVDSTQAIVGDFKTQITDVNDIIENSGPVLDSQVKSRDNIERWARNLNRLAAQSAQQDQRLKSLLHQAAPTADQVNDLFSGVRESLPQTLANLEVVFDLLKRYHTGVEQVLVFLPQGASIAQTVAAPFPNMAALDLALSINQPPPCLTGFIPASEWRSRRTPAFSRCRRARTARSRWRPRPTACAGRATSPVRTSRANGRPPAGMPRPQAVRSGGHQPLVRRPQPDPDLPRAGSEMRSVGAPGHGDPRAVDQQRAQPRALGPGGGDSPAHQRSVVAAGVG